MRPVLAALVAAAVALGVFVVVTGTTLPAARTAAAPALGPATPPAAAPDTAVFAPVDRPGPPLSVPAGMLAASLRCTDDLARSRLDPVLLLSGTAADPDENLGWNIGPALRWAGFPVCTSTAPDRNLGDIQVRGEYVVHAIRAVAERSGRKVALVGHSQGGMVGRWALRFWPDTRGLVSDLVGLAPTNDGAASLSDMCTQPCAAAFWQQRQGSDFVAALNSDRRTFPGISYTVVSSTTDLVATPQPAASALPAAEPGGAGPGSVANIAVQDVCPGRTADHVEVGTSDAVTWALVLDALTHDGPADPARVGAVVCRRNLLPGLDRAELAANRARVERAITLGTAGYARVPAEPPLACYTRSAGC